MENQKSVLLKTSSEAIKSLVSRAVPANKKKHTKYAVNVFQGLAEFTQISFVVVRAEGYKINKPLPCLLVYRGI